MQGQQDSQRVLFDTVDLESLIPDDHLLRRIDARVDFDFIYDVTKDLYLRPKMAASRLTQCCFSECSWSATCTG